MKSEIDMVKYQTDAAMAMAEVYAASATLTTALAKLNALLANPPRVVVLDNREPSAEVQEAVQRIIKDGRDAMLANLNGKPTPEIIEKVREMQRREAIGHQANPIHNDAPPAPGVPGDISLEPDEGKHAGVQNVLRANGIPFRRLSAGDYVLTDHVVTEEVLELFRTHLGSVGWSVSGAVTGPMADLRRRPDLFRPKTPAGVPAPVARRPEVVTLPSGETIISATTPVPQGYGLGSTLGAGKEWITERPKAFDGSTGLRNPVIDPKGDSIPNSGNKE
jgi:hypothetical protein